MKKPNTSKNNSTHEIFNIVNQSHLRKAYARKSFVFFFTVYCSNLVDDEYTDFHSQWINSIDEGNNIGVVSYVGSGKKNILLYASLLWRLLKEDQNILVFFRCEHSMSLFTTNLIDLIHNLKLYWDDFGKDLAVKTRSRATQKISVGSNEIWFACWESNNNLYSKYRRYDHFYMDECFTCGTTWGNEKILALHNDIAELISASKVFTIFGSNYTLDSLAMFIVLCIETNQIEGKSWFIRNPIKSAGIKIKQVDQDNSSYPFLSSSITEFIHRELGGMLLYELINPNKDEVETRVESAILAYFLYPHDNIKDFYDENFLSYLFNLE